jgi:hypothetical protein
VKPDIARVQRQTFKCVVAVDVIDVRCATPLDEAVDEQRKVPTAREDRGSATSITEKRRPGPISPTAWREQRPHAHARASPPPKAPRCDRRRPNSSAIACRTSAVPEQQAVNGRELERRVVDVLHLDQREAAQVVHAHRPFDALPERLGGRQK